MGGPYRCRKLAFLVGIMALLAGIAPLGRAEPAPGERWLRIRIGGRERLCLVHVPPGYDGTRAVPLVLALHGEGGNAELMQRRTGLTTRARRDVFIVAYPNGTGTSRRRGLTWNVGDCCGYAQEKHVDDVAFLRALTDQIQGDLKVDARRIYVTGLGNGGMMAYRLACALSGRIAAVAVVGGTMMGKCQPTQPVSVLAIHGTEDSVVPYRGGKAGRPIGADGQLLPSVTDTVAFWVKFNGCQTTPRRTEGGGLVVETYPGGKGGSEVSLITLQGGGHAWPSGAPPAFSATNAVLDFFRAHARPASP